MASWPCGHSGGSSTEAAHLTPRPGDLPPGAILKHRASPGGASPGARRLLQGPLRDAQNPNCSSSYQQINKTNLKNTITRTFHELRNPEAYQTIKIKPKGKK